MIDPRSTHGFSPGVHKLVCPVRDQNDVVTAISIASVVCAGA